MPASSRDSELHGRETLEKGGGARRKVERQKLWVDYLLPKKKKSKLRGRDQRRPFDLT